MKEKLTNLNEEEMRSLAGGQAPNGITGSNASPNAINALHDVAEKLSGTTAGNHVPWIPNAPDGPPDGGTGL